MKLVADEQEAKGSMTRETPLFCDPPNHALIEQFSTDRTCDRKTDCCGSQDSFSLTRGIESKCGNSFIGSSMDLLRRGGKK